MSVEEGLAESLNLNAEWDPTQAVDTRFLP